MQPKQKGQPPSLVLVTRLVSSSSVLKGCVCKSIHLGTIIRITITYHVKNVERYCKFLCIQLIGSEQYAVQQLQRLCIVQSQGMRDYSNILRVCDVSILSLLAGGLHSIGVSLALFSKNAVFLWVKQCLHGSPLYFVWSDAECTRWAETTE